MISRRQFLQFAAAATVAAAGHAGTRPDQRAGKPRGSEFVFARLRYDSGDWDYNPKVAANVLDSIIQYTSIPVYKEEVVIAAAPTELLSFPFVFMTGHKLVRFSAAERENLRRFADAGGLLFSDDCNHDVNGLYAKIVRAGNDARRFPDDAAGEAAGVASALSQLLHVQGRTAADVARAERLGRQHRPRVPEGRSSGAAASRCSTATRTTAASGTTTGATSASCARTTRSSPSTSSSTR